MSNKELYYGSCCRLGLLYRWLDNKYIDKRWLVVYDYDEKYAYVSANGGRPEIVAADSVRMLTQISDKSRLVGSVAYVFDFCMPDVYAVLLSAGEGWTLDGEVIEHARLSFRSGWRRGVCCRIEKEKHEEPDGGPMKYSVMAGKARIHSGILPCAVCSASSGVCAECSRVVAWVTGNWRINDRYITIRTR